MTPPFYVMLGEKSAAEAQTLEEARTQGRTIFDAELIPSICWISDAEGNHIEDIGKSDGQELAQQVNEFNKHFR